MKISHPVLHSERADLRHAPIQATEHPEKICIVFEDDVSTESAEVLIKNNSVPVKISISDLNNHN